MSPEAGVRDPVTTLVVSAILSIAAWSSAAAVDVTACGQTIARRDVGVLVADLDCSASPFGVRLLRHATLDLNGHSIAGGDSTVATVVGVGSSRAANPIGYGRGRFTILGPGSITGTSHPPINSTGTRACVLVNDGVAAIGMTGTVEISGCIYGIHGARRFTRSGEPVSSGPNGRGRVTLEHATVADTGESGVAVMNLTASDVTATGNRSIGLGATRRMIVSNVTANQNVGIGLFGGKLLQGSDVVAMDNAYNGVDTCGFGRIELTNLSATGNGLYGVCGDEVRLTDSTAIDNQSGDIFSFSAPELVNVTCNTSSNQNNSSWNVCAND